ncbi:DoxX family protein [Mucilaginibacter sp.]|jgi:putative oxidoreductase|uniref:DoxX family protein n=1 Tax=Mucilaginibacter sp. TaxID=1882438 RepID=UPI002632C81F|nr:DoxX family protein [Mucilaginibacter sp.]MDB5126017.1 DoxX family rane protein [Mucilaginibacter sp.]
MSVINKIEKWGDRHHPAVLDVLRIMLGIFLFLKGLSFMENMSYLRWIIEDQQLLNLSPFFLKAVMYYVTFVHMAGGILITLGLLTRLSSLLQLPIVISALFVINIFRSEPNNDLWLSIFACVLLIIFSLIGSGPLSLNNLLSPKEQDNAKG